MVMLTILASAALLTACSATDGDTIRCGSERIRLTGIDAPEMRGHCRRGRSCAPGDPIASKKALAKLLTRRPVTIRRLGRDRYGRTLALVAAGGVDLSCAQLKAGRAIYKPQWDNRKILAKSCSSHTR